MTAADPDRYEWPACRDCGASHPQPLHCEDCGRYTGTDPEVDNSGICADCEDDRRKRAALAAGHMY